MWNIIIIIIIIYSNEKLLKMKKGRDEEKAKTQDGMSTLWNHCIYVHLLYSTLIISVCLYYTFCTHLHICTATLFGYLH